MFETSGFAQAILYCSSPRDKCESSRSGALLDSELMSPSTRLGQGEPAKPQPGVEVRPGARTLGACRAPAGRLRGSARSAEPSWCGERTNQGYRLMMTKLLIGEIASAPDGIRFRMDSDHSYLTRLDCRLRYRAPRRCARRKRSERK